jgi:autotransporter family porin
MKPYRKPIMAIMVVLLALIPAACGTELMGGVNAKTADSSCMVAGMASGGSEGSSSVAFMQGDTELNKNFQVNQAQLQSIINVLGGSIQKAVDAANNGDTIKVWPGLYKENVHVPISVIIQGSGALWTIVDGQQKDSVFEVGTNPEAVVTLSDMTIRNGQASNGGGISNEGTLTVTHCILKDNTAFYDGGGLYIDHSKVTVKDCIIRDNEAMNGGGIFVNGEGNPGIFVNGEGGTDVTASLNLINSQVLCNKANYGGGIYNDAENGDVKSILNLVDSQVFGNTAILDGGGIYNDGRNNFDATAILTLTSSQIYGNTAANGGGIYNDGRYGGAATVTIANSQIYGNKAIATSFPAPCIGGGGIYNNGQGGKATATLTNSQIFGNTGYLGGGIKNLDGTLNVYFSQITGNKAKQDGGGIYWAGTAPTISSSLIFGNTPNNIAHA